MKKYFVLVLLMIGVFFSLQSQNWCPPGAKWHYAWKAGGLNLNGMVSYEYKKDTILNGQNCKQIKGTFYGIWDPVFGSQQMITKADFRTHYTYEFNKVVYAYNGNNFDTIVNYNANIGDKWLQLGRSTWCNNMVPLIVKDTGHVVINNKSLKSIVLTYSTIVIGGLSTRTVSHTYTLVEKLGNLTSLYEFSDIFPQFCDNGGIPENPTTSFKCYQDNNFPLYEISPSACNNVLGLDGQNQLIKNIQIYPNPNAGHFTINISEPSRIILINSLGQTILQRDCKEAGDYEQDISNLQNGIYLVTVSNEFHKTYLKLIKE